MHSSFIHSLFFLLFLGWRLQMGMLRHPIEASGWGGGTEWISSSIQEMMAGPNTILNRTRGDVGYKSILRPNDDHHLEHIFRAHCCLDVWLSWGTLIHKTTHWSYVEVTFKRGMLKARFEVSLRESQAEKLTKVICRIQRDTALRQTQGCTYTNA